MIDDMVARKLVPGTQRSHVFACKQFVAYLGRSPETASPDDVRSFQRHLIASCFGAFPGDGYRGTRIQI